MDQLFETTSFYFFLVNSHQFEIYYYKKLTFNVKGFLPYRFSCYPYYGSDYAPILRVSMVYIFTRNSKTVCNLQHELYFCLSTFSSTGNRSIGSQCARQGYKSSNYFSYRLFQLIIEFSSLFEKCLFLFLQIIFSSRN